MTQPQQLQQEQLTTAMDSLDTPRQLWFLAALHGHVCGRHLEIAPMQPSQQSRYAQASRAWHLGMEFPMVTRSFNMFVDKLLDDPPSLAAEGFGQAIFARHRTPGTPYPFM